MNKLSKSSIKSLISNVYVKYSAIASILSLIHGNKFYFYSLLKWYFNADDCKDNEAV